MHFSLLREFVRNELGADPEELFDEFETRAFAAASLGQVHRARLKGSDRRVAIKVQYPNIGRTIRDDFRNLIALLMPMRLSGDWDNLRAQFEEVHHMLEMETDYEREAENQRIARSAFTEDEGIVVPQVFAEYSTKRILTMDYIPGLHLDEFLATDPPQELRDSYGHKICVALIRTQQSKKVLYADPQPGNYLFMPDGRLGAIDFGCCYHETREDIDLTTKMERLYFETPHTRGSLEAQRDTLAWGNDLTAKQAGQDDRMKMIMQWGDWAWEPVMHEGPFDFSDPEYFRRGAEMYGEFIRRRYMRSRPANTWLIKTCYGMRAMLTRLKARVNYGAIWRAETRVPEAHRG